MSAVETVLLTHFHTDHVTGLPSFVFGSWTQGRQSLTLVGPGGTQRMWDLYAEMFEHDITYRVGLGWPKAAMSPAIHEVHDGWQQELGDLIVTVTFVDHVGPNCVGYRFDHMDRSVVISGDTAYSPNLVKLARQADVLVNNCSISRPPEEAGRGGIPWSRLMATLSDHVCTPQAAGRMALEADVATLVLTHLQPGTDDDYVLEGVAQSGYRGSVIVGHDLKAIDVWSDGDRFHTMK